MNVKHRVTVSDTALRKMADAVLRKNPRSKPVLKTADVQRLVHELQVYQTELETRNEELRAAHLELAASRDRYAELYDFAPVGYIMLNATTGIIQANGAAIKMLGLKRSAIKNGLVKFSRLVSRECQDEWRRFSRTMFAGEEKQRCELTLRKSDKGPLTVLLESVAERGETSSLDCCMVALIDISERKKMEEEIAGLAKIHSENPHLVLRLNPKGIVCSSNAATAPLLRFWGLEKGGAVPLTLLKEIEAAFASGRERVAELECEGRTYSFSVVPLADEGYVNLYGKDVTERKRLEIEIKRNEARLTNLLRLSQYQAGSIRQLLDFALDEALAITGSKIGYIYRYDDVTKEFTLNSWSKEAMEECTITERQTVYQLEKTGLWGEAVRQAKPIVVNDFHAPHPLKKGFPEGHAPLHRYLTVPVFTKGHIVGVVGVANKETDYDDADVRQLTLLTDAAWKISDRTQAEEALRQSEERFRVIAETTPVGIGVVALPEAKFVYVNEAYETSFGYSQKELIGRETPDIYWSIEDRERILGILKEKGNVAEYEVKLKRKDGTPFWGLSSVRPITYGGKPALLGTFVDITERKRTEEMLRETKDYLDKLIRYANAPIIVWDPDMQITRFNGGFEKLTDAWRASSSAKTSACSFRKRAATFPWR